MNNTIITINKNKFENNLKIIKSIIGENTKYCLPVKANAYGHDILLISRIAQNYVDYFGVSCIDEGVLLRQNGIIKPILVFGSFSEYQIETFIKYNIDITVSSFLRADQIIAFCKKHNVKCNVHLKVDTGMHRIGISVKNVNSLIDHILSNKELCLLGVYSHLANSELVNDNYTIEQINQFNLIIQYVKNIYPNVICHIANSSGLINYPYCYHDMVRPGILSYGYITSQQNHHQLSNLIQPCFTLKSKIIYNKIVDANKHISYKGIYVTKSKTRIVTIPIGYGDGYRKILSNQGEVLFKGKKYKISGEICMDMLMLNLESCYASVEEEVVLIGEQMGEVISMESIATKCNTHIYEIMCSFTSRIPRVIE